MGQPTEYTRSTNFNDYSTSNPSSPHQGSSLDAEFNDIKTSTDMIRTNMALLQRDDGKLANVSVHAEALSNAVLTLIKATSNGYGVKGAWTAETAYAVGDLVDSSQATYLCFEAHTSGLTFEPNSPKFILLANAAIQATASAVDTLSGDGSTVTFTLSNNSPSGVTDVLVFVNGSLRTPTTDYTIPSSTQITFGTAPSNATNNIIIWGTSTVVEAAKAAAQSARDVAETHRDDASEHKTTAERWANKTDGTVVDADTLVDSTEFSSKAYASSTDSNEPTTGSSKNWSNKATTEVETGEGYSSKAYAQDETTGTDTTGGSSKGWSQTAKNTQVPGAGTSDRSAKHYSEVASDHKTGAESARDAAQEWATNVGSAEVQAGQGYSSKAYAQNTGNNIGSAKDWATLATQVASTDWSSKSYAQDTSNNIGSSKDWATKTSAFVNSVDGSAKAWAIGGTGVDTGDGSAKDWATKASGTVGSSSLKSAKQYADSVSGKVDELLTLTYLADLGSVADSVATSSDYGSITS